ncbi:MAG: hypothetical protein ACLFM7_01760 [Bacteroidales bacterium]
MENLSRDNYEAYFMDYLDGKLDSYQENDLMVFLRDNPDLKEELEMFKNVPPVKGEDVSLRNKNTLKKQRTLSDPDYTIFDELCLANLEGNLSAKQKKEFNQLIKAFPEKKKEYELYEKTLLKPDRAIRYTDKFRLKKRRLLFLHKNVVYWYVAMAASFLLLVGLYFFFSEQEDIPYNDKLDNQSQIVDDKSNKNFYLPPFEPDVADKALSLNHSSIEYKELSSQIKVEEKLSISHSVSKPVREEAPEPIQTRYSIRISENPVHAGLVEPFDVNRDFNFENPHFNNFDKVGRFLSSTLKQPIRNTSANRNFSLWNIAGLSLEGISKLTGKEIMLEKHYNGKGELERLALQTESFKVSTSLKK